MREEKDISTQASADQALEHHVDAMMDPKLPDEPGQAAQPEDQPTKAAEPQSIDIFASSPPTAPEVTPEMAREIVKPTDKMVALPLEPDQAAADDTATDAAVDEITAHESDEVLAAQDAEIARAFDGHRPTFRERLNGFFAAWWSNKTARWATAAALGVIIGTVAVIPTSRYYLLNTAGIRVSSSLTILDGTTQLPLKNVQVSLSDKSAKTNRDGFISLNHIKLGKQPLVVRQPGFATISRTITLGLGSNPLGHFVLKAVGTQYQFKIVHYLSGKAVGGAEATSGDANAKADSNGKIVLTVGPVPGQTLPVTISADGYRVEQLSIPADNIPATTVALVPIRKEVYVSKQSGRYDIYKSDIDGRNKQLLLAGSGSENAQMTLVAHPTDEEAALVSTRDNLHDQDGYQLQALTLIDTGTGTTLTLDHSEQIQLVGWTSDQLVYVRIKAGSSAGTPDRYQLMSYDYKAATRLQLASANYFNDVVFAGGSVYYAASNNYQGGKSQFAKVNPDNTGKQVLLSGEVWNAIRSSYGSLNLSTMQGWYGYQVGASAAQKSTAPPANSSDSRFYLDSPDGTRALWTDNRDGKGVLLQYDIGNQKDTVLATQSGLGSPLRWLDSDTIIYRVNTPQETADYAVSLDGGTPKKITDVTASAGFGKWYYY